MTQDPDLANALEYLSKHPTRYLFPLVVTDPVLRPKGQPAIKNNLALASNDAAQLKRWYNEHRQRGRILWACAPKKSGLVPIDVDRGPGKVGAQSFEALVKEHGPFPKTELVTTPSGGLHYIYEGEHHFSTDKLGKNIDVPNYFLIAGTVLVDFDDTSVYSVKVDAPVAKLPEWIAEKIKPRSAERSNKPPLDPIPLDVFKKMLKATPYENGPEGLNDRHNYQGWLTFLMECHEAAGGDEGEYLDAVIEWSLADPNPDWTQPTSAEYIECKWQSFTADPPKNAAARTRGSWLKLLIALDPKNTQFAGDANTAETDFADDPITDEEIADYTRRQNEPEDIPADMPGMGRNSGLVVLGFDTVKSRNVDFIWPGRLARGKHTALAGIGGIGKSQITVDMVARCTNGSPWPDVKEIKAAGWPKELERAPRGNCIIMSAEDAPDDTIKPRLIAAGADPKFVKFLSMVKDAKGNERKFNLQTDLEALKKYCLALGNVVLIVIDPASSYMGGDVDASKNTKVRHVLDPITRLAEDLQCAIVSITHFRKGTSANAVEKVMDSVAFVNAPRCALAVYPDPNDIGAEYDAPGYVMLRLKSNLPGTPPCGLSYRIEGVEGGEGLMDYRDGKPIKTSRIIWQGRTDLTADQVAQMENDKGTPKLDEARRFLAQRLADGPVLVAEIMAEAEAEGLAPDTVKRAKRALKIKAVPPSEPGGSWAWQSGRDLDLD